jgi:capsular polysaccharide biosynthesis protein
VCKNIYRNLTYNTEEDKMELLEYIHIIKKRLGIILITTILAAVASGIFSIFVMDPIYEAKATLIVGRIPSNQTEKMQYNDVLMYGKLVKTYAELAKSDLVAGETITKTGYDLTEGQLKGNLTVTPKGDTQILEIAVRNGDAEKAYKLANAVSEVFVDKVRSMMNTEDVKIMDYAKLPGSPIKPRVMLNIVIAGFVGFMVALGIVFLMEYLDNTIKTESDVEKYLGITVLATIPFVKEEEK